MKNNFTIGGDLTMATGKKPVIIHHITDNNYTDCGVDLYEWESKDVKAKTRKTWAAVINSPRACKRCLAAKKKQDATKALNKKWKSAKVGCSV